VRTIGFIGAQITLCQKTLDLGKIASSGGRAMLKCEAVVLGDVMTEYFIRSSGKSSSLPPTPPSSPPEGISHPPSELSEKPMVSR
jgi:hypothetical protein